MTCPLSHRAKRRAAYREMRRDTRAKLVTFSMDGHSISRRCLMRETADGMSGVAIGPATETWDAAPDKGEHPIAGFSMFDVSKINEPDPTQFNAEKYAGEGARRMSFTATGFLRKV